MDTPAAEIAPPESEEVFAIGDAADMTEGTSNRSGSEDKRYKYR